MIPADHLSRRQFVKKSALAAAAVTATASPAESAATAPPWKIIASANPSPTSARTPPRISSPKLAGTALNAGSRAKAGHIAPERVEDDLPKMVEALKKRGKEVVIVTTEITKLDPLAERILRTTAKLGIKKYRLGFTKYTKDKTVPETVNEVGAALKELSAFNRELGLQGGWQNHSGADYVGAPIWDLWTMIRDLDPKTIGVCFDIGHATLETSYDSHTLSAELSKLFDKYQAGAACHLDVFKQGVSCSSADWKNWGSGAGLTFQALEKECPAFAAEYAAVMLRVSGGSGGHYGPLRTKAAEIRSECDGMLSQIEASVQQNPGVCAELVNAP